MGNTGKILSLDGGGSWAVLQAMALGKIYGPKTSGIDILKNFKIVSANSGGSLVLASLLMNWSPEAIVKFFDNYDRRKSLFKKITTLPPPLNRFVFFNLRSLLKGVVPQYETSQKKKALLSILQSQEIQNEALQEFRQTILKKYKIPEKQFPHFVIVGFDYDRCRVKFFKSNRNSNASNSSNLHESKEATLVDAVHASTNAPLQFFNNPAQLQGTLRQYRYWDGAVSGFNNPVLAAVTEAVYQKIDPSKMKILSIGTGTVVLPVAQTGFVNSKDLPTLNPDSSDDYIDDLTKMARSILDDPPDQATFLAHTGLSGGKLKRPATPITRLNPVIRPVLNAEGVWDYPGIEQLTEPTARDLFNNLRKLPMDAVEPDEYKHVKELGNLWLQDLYPNQPVRMSNLFQCEIGYETFTEAVKKWK